MIHAKLLGVIFLLFSYGLMAGELTKAVTDLSPEAELIALDDAWIEAEVKADRKALERILHEDFLATFSSGKTVDRTAYIDFIVGQEIPPFKVVHDVIRVHGDTALVIDISESGKTKFVWIAKRFEGQWRVIAETFSKMEAP